MGFVGQRVAAVEEVPQRVVDRDALVRGEGDALLQHAAAFLLDLLALVALQAGQQFGEVGNGAFCVLCPVELHALAQQPAGGGEGGLVGFVAEEHVCRRQFRFARVTADGVDESRAPRRAACQQPAARHRREGHCPQQLGVVAQAVAAVGIGPGPVEDVLAVGMALQVQRRGRHQRAIGFQRDELRRPARLGYRTARRVQRGQVLQLHEGRGRSLRGEQGVPGLGIQRAGVAMNPDDIIFFDAAVLRHSRPDDVEMTR